MKSHGILLEPVPRLPAIQGPGAPWLDNFPMHPYCIPETKEPVNIFSVLKQRRSSREFDPLPAERLSALLFHTAKTLEVGRREISPDWEHRPLPASGGCHAVQILVVPPELAGYPCGIYDSRAHGCRVIDSGEARFDALRAVEDFQIKGRPTLLLFFVDPSRIEGYYLNWESLVWRDSGVLIGGMSLTATALDLKFCPLGFSGTSIVRNFLPLSSVIGVGGCVVGL